MQRQCLIAHALLLAMRSMQGRGKALHLVVTVPIDMALSYISNHCTLPTYVSALYLSICTVSIHCAITYARCAQMSCRYTLDVLLAGEDAPYSRARHVGETAFIVFASLGVALLFPTAAEKIFAVTGARLLRCAWHPLLGYHHARAVCTCRTAGCPAWHPMCLCRTVQGGRRTACWLAGATAVCVVCYVIPVALHLRIYFSPGGYQTLRQQQQAAEAACGIAAPLLQARTSL